MASSAVAVQASASATSTEDGTSVSGQFIVVTSTPRRRRVHAPSTTGAIPFSLASPNSFAALASDDEDDDYDGSSTDASDSDEELVTGLPHDEVTEYLSRKTHPVPSKRKKRRDPTHREAAIKATATIYTEVTGRRKRRRVAPHPETPFADIPAPPSSSSSSASTTAASTSTSEACTESPSARSHRKPNPIYLWFTEVDTNPYRQGHRPDRRDRHYRSNYALPGQHQGQYYTITPRMNGSTNALVSHLRVHFPEQYKIFLDLKTSGRSPTLGEVRIAQALATSQEVEAQLKDIQEKEDALLAALASEKFDPEKFQKLLGEWLVACDQPFTEVQRPELRRVFQYIHGNTPLDIPSANTMQRRINELGGEAVEEVRKMIREFSGMVGIALDAWTSCNGHAFMAIVMQYLDEDWNIQELLIDFKELIGEHSGENMAHLVWGTLEFYGLVGRVMAFTADNATNNDTLIACIEERCKELGIPFSAKVARVRCPPHTIHLAVIERLETSGLVSKSEADDLRTSAYQESVTAPLGSEAADDEAASFDDSATGVPIPDLPSTERTPSVDEDGGSCSMHRAVNKLRVLIRAIRSSPQRRELWFQLLAKFPPKSYTPGTPYRPKLPILDCHTRWSSLHQCFERAIDHADVLDVIAASLSVKDKSIVALSADEWAAIRLVTGWLQVFRRATTRMSSANILTLSTVHLIFRMLQDELRDAYKATPASAPQSLKAGLLRAHRKLSDYYMKFDVSPYYTWAALLDPRISFTGLLNDCEDDAATLEHIHTCKRRLEEHFLAHYATATPAPSAMPTSHATNDTLTDADLFAHYDSGATSLTPARELIDYFSLNPAEARALQLQPSHWWKLNQYRFPCLSKLARDVFSIPGSAVSVERVFSSARDTLSLRRTSMKADTLRSLMLFKHKLLLRRRNLQALMKEL